MENTFHWILHFNITAKLAQWRSQVALLGDGKRAARIFTPEPFDHRRDPARLTQKDRTPLPIDAAGWKG